MKNGINRQITPKQSHQSDFMHVCFKVNALPAEMRFTIRVNGTEKELDNMTPEASFELDCGEYAVELRSAATASIPKLPDWLIYFSTMGIFHILILKFLHQLHLNYSSFPLI